MIAPNPTGVAKRAEMLQAIMADEESMTLEVRALNHPIMNEILSRQTAQLWVELDQMPVHELIARFREIPQ